MLTKSNEICNYLTNTMSFTKADIGKAFSVQGLNTFDDLLMFSDDDLQNLCDRIRKGSGLVTNPAQTLGNRSTTPAQIKGPGVTIGWMHELKLRKLRYAQFHFDRIQHSFLAAEVPMERLNALWSLFEEEVRTKDSPSMDLTEPLTHVDNVRETLEDIANYLENTLGAIDTPLSYIIRENPLKPENRTPAVNTPFSTLSLKKELIDRVALTGLKHKAKNAAVWQVICHVTHGGPAWNWVQGNERSQDGRAVYLTLQEHCRGDSYQVRTKATATSVINNTFYEGKSRNFTFETYTQRLNSAFEDMAACGELLVEDAKVRHLMHGIRVPHLTTACDAIMLNESIRTSFPTTVNALSEVIGRKQASTPTRHISSMGRNNNSGDRGGHYRANKPGRGDQGRTKQYNPNMVITDCHYLPEEWAVISSAQKARALELRSARDKRRGVMSVGRGSPPKRPREDTDGHYGPPTPPNQNNNTGTNQTAGIGSMMSRRNQNNRS